MNTVNIADKFSIGSGKLTLIGGPCTAESRELCLEVADFLKTLCAELDINYIFKASYDKANRSGATSVRGPGLDAGLGYLQAVKDKYSLPVLTDIHDSSTVDEVSSVADVLQIPAFLCRHGPDRYGKPVYGQQFRRYGKPAGRGIVPGDRLHR